MKIRSILKKAVQAPASLVARLVLTPLENKMNDAIKAALASTIRKTLRVLLAVAASAALAALPAMQQVFADAATHGSMVEKGVFGAIVAALVGAMAFLERYVAASKTSG